MRGLLLLHVATQSEERHPGLGDSRYYGGLDPFEHIQSGFAHNVRLQETIASRYHKPHVDSCHRSCRHPHQLFLPYGRRKIRFHHKGVRKSIARIRKQAKKDIFRLFYLNVFGAMRSSTSYGAEVGSMKRGACYPSRSPIDNGGAPDRQAA
jgi:hypothetical protein